MNKNKITEITGLSTKEIEETIALAKIAVKQKQSKNPEEGEIFLVNSFIVNKKEYCGVLINIPVSPKPVRKHVLAVLDETFKSVILNGIPEHYFQGDIMYRATSKKTKPRVVRHYFITPNDFGRKRITDVDISTKVDLLTGEENIIINIRPRPNGEIEKPRIRMVFGVPAVGKEEEYKIPETNLCIRFDKTIPYIK